jgi:ribosome-binding factor A
VANRTLRINELVQRELSDYLHRHHQAETVDITVTSVEVAPDLRTGRIYVGVLGDAERREERLRWLRRHAAEIRQELARRVVLKWSPKWEFLVDDSGERGARILQVLNELEGKESRGRPPAPPA